MAFSQRPDTACARVTGGTGALTAQWNIASSTRTGAGAYTVVTNITFDTTSIVFGQCIGGAGNANLQVNNPSVDFITWLVTTFVIAAATDENFTLYFERAVF